MKKETGKVYFEHLDVLRFVAAIMIVFLHSYESIGWFDADISSQLDFVSNNAYADQFMKNLGIGVDVFFLISGFLITYLLLEEKKRFGTIAIKKFIVRRILRLWPVYFAIVLVAPVLVILTQSPDPNYLPNLFFLGNFDTIATQSWDYPFHHFWSICIEEHFYFVWPLVIAFIPFKYLLRVFIALIAVSIGFRCYAVEYLDHSWFQIYLNTLSRMDVIVIGAIAGYFYSKQKFDFKLPKYARITLLATLLVSLALYPISSWESLLEAGFKKYFYMGIILVLFLDYNFNSTYKHRLKSNSILHYFGKVSYGIYMYGNIVLLLIIKQIMWRFDIRSIWVYFTLVLIFSILIPIASYELFERPILKLKNRFRVIDTR
ncbi:MAG: acyltransferase family protein [Crocinitomicaceae bacterium]